MSPLRFIRIRVFAITQVEMASIAGVTQAQVSRWEKEDRQPSLAQLRRVRAEAQRRRLKWDDRWFFEPPKVAA